MFASYEVATSFPSLTAIKGYDLDKSSDVLLMGHETGVFTFGRKVVFGLKMGFTPKNHPK